MQKQLSWFLFAALLFTTVTACKKSEEDDKNNPVITISNPAANASISGAVSIAGKVTDESLHELSIVVTKDSDSSELFKSTPEVHDLTEYTIAETWTPGGISAETAVTLTVTAEDHHSNTATTTMKFKVKP